MRQTSPIAIGVVLALLTAVAFADPLTYRLVTQVGDEGTSPTGTITIREEFIGQGSYDISNYPTDYHFYVPGGPAGTVWDSSTADSQPSGTMVFAQGEVIGDAILHPAIPTPGDGTIHWSFYTPEADVAPTPLTPGWLTLQTLGQGSWDPGRNFWQWVIQAEPRSNDQHVTHGPTTAWHLELVPPVPEPGSFALIGLGGLGLLWFRRRRKSA